MCIFGARPLATLEQALDALPESEAIRSGPSFEAAKREKGRPPDTMVCPRSLQVRWQLEAQPKAELELARAAAAQRRVVVGDVRCRLRSAENPGRAVRQVAARTVIRRDG